MLSTYMHQAPRDRFFCVLEPHHLPDAGVCCCFLHSSLYSDDVCYLKIVGGCSKNPCSGSVHSSKHRYTAALGEENRAVVEVRV